MYKLLLTIFLGVFFSFFGQAQQYQNANKSLPCLNKEFTIVAHIMKDSLGISSHSETAINLTIETLNSYFEPICVSFKVCAFEYHNNFQYTHLTGPNDPLWQEMQTKYHQDNRINVYYVDSLETATGFASFSGISEMDSAGIVLQGIEAISHEMGHFFGLYHTHEGDGAELVDGSNCETTGDLVCDTPADAGEPGMTANCIFTGTMQDANGQYYTPDIGNIMSNYDGECTCGFTAGQLSRMANIYLGSSPKMW